MRKIGGIRKTLFEKGPLLTFIVSVKKIEVYQSVVQYEFGWQVQVMSSEVKWANNF